MGPTCLVFSNSGHEFLPTASFLLRVTLAFSSAPAMVTRWSTTEVAWSAEVPCCRCGRLVSNDWSWGQQKWPFYHQTNLKSLKSLSSGLLYTVPAGFCDYPPSEGLRSLNPARPLFLKEIWLKKVTFSTYYHKTLDIATSKRVDGRYFTT